MQSPAKIVKSAWKKAGKQVSLKTFARRTPLVGDVAKLGASVKWLGNKAKLHSQRSAEEQTLARHNPGVYVSAALRRGDRFAAKGGC